MHHTLFKKVRYPLGTLLDAIALNQIGLPDIQRHFVWSNAKVRDLFVRGTAATRWALSSPSIHENEGLALMSQDCHEQTIH